MSFPTTAPTLTQEQSFNAIVEAEAGIVQCLQQLLCETLLPAIAAITDSNRQAALIRAILCAYSEKEEAMGTLISALADKILADKGLVCNDAVNDEDNCD